MSIVDIYCYVNTYLLSTIYSRYPYLLSTIYSRYLYLLSTICSRYVRTPGWDGNQAISCRATQRQPDTSRWLKLWEHFLFPTAHCHHHHQISTHTPHSWFCTDNAVRTAALVTSHSAGSTTFLSTLICREYYLLIYSYLQGVLPSYLRLRGLRGAAGDRDRGHAAWVRQRGGQGTRLHHPEDGQT